MKWSLPVNNFYKKYHKNIIIQIISFYLSIFDNYVFLLIVLKSHKINISFNCLARHLVLFNSMDKKVVR
jgi:hypothetical protein